VEAVKIIKIVYQIFVTKVIAMEIKQMDNLATVQMIVSIWFVPIQYVEFQALLR